MLTDIAVVEVRFVDGGGFPSLLSGIFILLLKCQPSVMSFISYIIYCSQYTTPPLKKKKKKRSLTTGDGLLFLDLLDLIQQETKTIAS